ncbi:hypothetical protein [Xylocopilactobacillus apicola]|uniref:Uncharacterized protein n=1 Tax=Xylocopilactobacillus apicola TaxID=2932184 RepID=A0AAU9D5V5_9LACO|nr:hypothetical protein [Xylocopilactobacillus apicola]BDR57791.1 hypothetical protein XA3_02320 [Xylocopilactobacillus apicola]
MNNAIYKKRLKRKLINHHALFASLVEETANVKVKYVEFEEPTIENMAHDYVQANVRLVDGSEITFRIQFKPQNELPPEDSLDKYFIKQCENFSVHNSEECIALERPIYLLNILNFKLFQNTSDIFHVFQVGSQITDELLFNDRNLPLITIMFAEGVVQFI